VPGAIEDHVLVQELTHRLGEVSERIRARMDRLGELDAASQDVLVEVVRELEQQLWMIRAQFPRAGNAAA
jgi:starvation-inducible DNA-binding protein